MPRHPVNQALKAVLHSFVLPHGEFSESTDEIQMDLDQARYSSSDDLKSYCRRVAGVVGCLTARILGFTQPQALKYADKMGLALQLTNIIRDVDEDARKGRIHLPAEDMQRFGVPASIVMHSVSTSRLVALMASQIGRACETHRQAVLLLPAADKKFQKVGLIMVAIYYVLFNEIGRGDVKNVLTYKIVIPLLRKKRTVLRTWLFGSRP